jgi:hypothetical protein
MPIKAEISQGTLQVRIRPGATRLIQICLSIILLLIVGAELLPASDSLRTTIQTQPILGPLVLSAVALASF